MNGELERHIPSNPEGSLLSAQSTYAMSMGPEMSNFVNFLDKQDIPFFLLDFLILNVGPNEIHLWADIKQSLM